MAIETRHHYRCDRCGAKTERPTPMLSRSSDALEGWGIITVKRRGGQLFIENGDLCNECTEAFITWFRSPNKEGN